jgi:hypothetical protein
LVHRVFLLRPRDADANEPIVRSPVTSTRTMSTRAIAIEENGLRFADRKTYVETFQWFPFRFPVF